MTHVNYFYSWIQYSIGKYFSLFDLYITFHFKLNVVSIRELNRQVKWAVRIILKY